MKPLPPLEAIDRLLVVKTSSLGDVIHALPAVQALKAARPGLSLGWVVRRRCADLLYDCPFIDDLHVISDRPTLTELAGLPRTLRGYQVALDMQGLALSGLVTRLSGAPVRVGWDRNREMNALCLTHPVVPGRASQVGVRHEVDLLYGFPRALGVAVPPGDFPPQTWLADPCREEVAERPGGLPRPRVALNVGAARAYKRWPLGHWAALAGALAARGVSTVFVGDKNDAAAVAEVCRSLPTDAKFTDLAGKTSLRALAAVLAGCDLVVSGDTGPMHLAVAVGTPVVALFGATDPRRHGAYGPRNTVLCDPASVTAARPTPEQGTAAMHALLPGMVLAAVEARVRVAAGSLKEAPPPQ